MDKLPHKAHDFFVVFAIKKVIIKTTITKIIIFSAAMEKNKKLEA